MRARALAPLLFASGSAALLLEVCWFRRMAQVAGGQSVAMAAVLAAVIGGMALGAFVFGRRADAMARPQQLYAAVELGVAAFALLTPTMIGASQGLFAWAYGNTALQFLVATLLLAPPAILMGGTLPAAVAALARPDGRSIGWLYAANTAGAVAGTLMAGFFLIPALGLSSSMRCAALLSAGAGAAALLMRSQRTGGRAAPSSGEDARRAIRLYAASGFLGLVCEVAFTRQLVLVFGSTTYAFSTMLAVFLFGIGLGSAFGTRCRKNHLRRLEWTLAVTAALFSLSALCIYLLPRLYLQGYLAWGKSFEAGLLLRFALAAAVLLPGSIGLGLAFPLAAHAAGRSGTGMGRLYAANTVASVLGSTLAVFVLVPVLGPQRTIAAAALVAGLACGRRCLALLAVTACGLIPPTAVAREHLLAGVFFAPDSFLIENRIDESTWEQGVDLPFVAYGREATVAVWRWYGRDSLLIDGKAVASDQILQDVQHLSLLGHLPMALHPDPQRVLVVGLGMGSTYLAVRMHRPRVLRVVEIEPAVVRAAARFDARPHDLVIGDARTYLRTIDEKFDVITSDPIHPWVRGGGDLYTVEYFRSVRDHLSSRGVACQWLPVYQMGLRDIQDIVYTFTRVFHAQAFYAGGDLVLVGVAQGRLPAPRRVFPQTLARLGARDLGKLRVARHERLARVKGKLLTDDALRLEFSTPRQFAMPELASCLAWILDLWGKPPEPYGAVLRYQIEWARGGYALDDLDLARKQAPRNAFVRTLSGENWLLRAGYDVRAHLPGNASRALLEAGRYLPGDPRVKGTQAELYAIAGQPALARRLFEELLRRAPESAYLRRRIKALE